MAEDTTNFSIHREISLPGNFLSSGLLSQCQKVLYRSLRKKRHQWFYPVLDLKNYNTDLPDKCAYWYNSGMMVVGVTSHFQKPIPSMGEYSCLVM